VAVWGGMTPGSQPRGTGGGDQRGLSQVVGVALLVAIVALLAGVTVTMAVTLGEDRLDSAAVHDTGQYAFDVEDAEDLEIRAAHRSGFGAEAEFVLAVNGEQVHEWDGTGTVEVECLYPGDRVVIRTADDEGHSRLVLTHVFDHATTCPQFNTFPEKFAHVVVEGNRYEVNDRYAFGLAIEPNGDNVATDYNGGYDMQLGQISLANRWHYVKLYDREIEGLEPPVFVVVMVDNVHWADVPDPSAHPEVSPGERFNWTDAPPSGLTTGADSYSLNGGTIVTDSSSATEPTNDVFLVFKPDCEESTLKFIEQNAGYANRIYLNDTVIVDDASTASPDQTFSAPGVPCRGDASWSD